MSVVPIKDHAAYERQQRRSAAGCLREVRERFKPRAVLVMGYDEDGDFFVQSSPSDPAEAMWPMERAKQKLLNPRGT